MWVAASLGARIPPPAPSEAEGAEQVAAWTDGRTAAAARGSDERRGSQEPELAGGVEIAP